MYRMPVIVSQNVRNGIDGDYYVKIGKDGSSTIAGDLTVDGTIFTDEIQPISTTEPLYINAPNEIGGTQLNNNALVVKGGENRVVDGSGIQVGIATYKPFTRGTVNHIIGEDVGAFASWGKDTSDNDVRYGSIFINTTDPRPTNKQGRMNFSIQKNNALSALLQIDGSQNQVSVRDGASLTVEGRISTLADISANTSIVAGTSITAGTTVSGATVSASGTVQGRQMTVASTTAMGGLGGIAFTVDTNSAGRLNNDASKMILNCANGSPSFPVEIQTNEKTALRATTDATNNITIQVGSSAVPRGGSRLTNVDASGTTTYWPSIMKTTNAISSGSDVVYSNPSAEVLTNSSFTAPYTGYYEFKAQFKATDISGFVAGTNTITFYADISGGGLTPIIGSTFDLTSVGNGNNFETTFSGYVNCTAGDIVRMIHIDEDPAFTITGGVLFILWKFLGAGTGLL